MSFSSEISIDGYAAAMAVATVAIYIQSFFSETTITAAN